MDTNDEWIVARTGIKQRRKLADTDNASDLGLVAARRALENAGINAGDLTHIVAATCTPDLLSPSVACILAGKLGAGPVMAFDFSAACSGFCTVFPSAGPCSARPRRRASFSSAPKP